MKLRLPPKLRIFLPIFAGIIISILAITILSINTARQALYASIEENLQLEVHNLMKMFEREYELKLEKVKTDLRVAHDYFNSTDFQVEEESISMQAVNQLNNQTHTVDIQEWILNGQTLQGNFEFVDKLQNLFGGTVTIFQKIDSGLLRISTNVLKRDGSRAVGTFIPNESPVVKSISGGETYFGRAFVVNDWYITAYEPIYYQGELVGALYVGGKEKDLYKLRNIIMGTTIGSSGFPYVFDENAVFIIHPVSEGESWSDLEFMQEIMQKKKGMIRYYSPTTQSRRLTAFDYFDDFHLFIGATINPEMEAAPLIRKIIINSVIFGLLILIGLSLFVYFVAAEQIYKYLQELESSNRKLSSAREALQKSEKLAELGQLSAAIAKEMSRPLSEIAYKAKSLKENFDPDSTVYSDLDKISTQADKGKNILSGILGFSQDNKLTLKETSINEMLLVTIKEVEIPSDININFQADPNNPVIYLDTGRMIQAVKNLIKHAADTMPAGGNIDIKAYSANRRVAISVRDYGPGIPEEEREKLFEPFYTSVYKRDEGPGLGLAVTQGIIRMHYGELRIKSFRDASKEPTGTEIIISLPRN